LKYFIVILVIKLDFTKIGNFLPTIGENPYKKESRRAKFVT